MRVSDKLRTKDRLAVLLENMCQHTKLSGHDLEPSARLIHLQNCSLSHKDKKSLEELYKRLLGGIRHLGMEWVFREMFCDFSKRCDGKVVLEKTPSHFLYVPIIKRVFPEAKFVVIVRNKRECVASHINTFDPRRNLTRRLMTKNMAIHSICREYCYYERIEKWAIKNLDAFVLEYDEFLSAPLEKTVQVCDWAGLDFDQEKNRDLYHARTLKPKWPMLTPKQQEIVEEYFPRSESV